MLSCASEKKIEKKDLIPPEAKSKDNFILFFEQCEKDINSAAHVIIEKDIVKNLTHLQNMDHDGKKYYILERENITKMIQSVTEGVYDDFILLNEQGKILYTKKNDGIFAKNVKSNLKDTPLLKCYNNKEKKVHFEDVALFGNEMEHFIFLSRPVKGKNSFAGTFILQLKTERVAALLKEKTAVIGHDTLVRLSNMGLEPFKPYADAESLNLLTGNSDWSDIKTASTPSGKKLEYRYFDFHDLKWLVISEK